MGKSGWTLREPECTEGPGTGEEDRVNYDTITRLVEAQMDNDVQLAWGQSPSSRRPYESRTRMR